MINYYLRNFNFHVNNNIMILILTDTKECIMEFRAPTVAKELNTNAIEYLTKNLSDPVAGRREVENLITKLGSAIDRFPDWHPILTIPKQGSQHVGSLDDLNTYSGIDHTVEFVRGFITCPYSDDTAKELVASVNSLRGLDAYQLEKPLYSDSAYPVVVEAVEVELEGDGTIRSRDALIWFAEETIKGARDAQVGETWWNIRSLILGTPHGSRSSLLVNSHTGSHMQKILKALNNSGMFGPIKESSLDMLSSKKRSQISENLIRTAVTNWDKSSETFSFELRGETCNVKIRDTWNDGHELSVGVKVGKGDLHVSGFYYEENDSVTHTQPMGKRAVAEKFL